MTSSIDLTPLRDFGAEAERKEFPCIAVGGFIVPGSGPAHPLHPEKEHSAHDTERLARTASTARQEARSPARPWQGSAAAAASPAAHAVGSRLGLPEWLQLEELDDLHPEARMLFSSSSCAVLEVPVGLFRTIPQRARLMLEIPLTERVHLTRSGRMNITPDVRAWATWNGGGRREHRITSHHEMPDGCICACREGEWIRGVHPLVDYMGYCITWIGKVLHERTFGFWPGPQHFGPLARARRDRPHEYCGCGGHRRYGDCCRDTDFAKSAFERWTEQDASRRAYLSELAWQGRAPHAPRS